MEVASRPAIAFSQSPTTGSHVSLRVRVDGGSSLPPTPPPPFILLPVLPVLIFLLRLLPFILARLGLRADDTEEESAVVREFLLFFGATAAVERPRGVVDPAYCEPLVVGLGWLLFCRAGDAPVVFMLVVVVVVVIRFAGATAVGFLPATGSMGLEGPPHPMVVVVFIVWKCAGKFAVLCSFWERNRLHLISAQHEASKFNKKGRRPSSSIVNQFCETFAERSICPKAREKESVYVRQPK